MNNRCIVLSFLACAINVAPLCAQAETTSNGMDIQENVVAWAKTCVTRGGTVLDLPIQFDSQTINGLKKSFCSFTDQNGHSSIIGLEMLATTTPTLAATYAQTLTYPTEGLPDYCGSPGLTLCLNLKGTISNMSESTSGYYDPESNGQMAICTFADGSVIDDNTLMYLIAGDAPHIKALITSPTIGMSLPDITARPRNC